MLPHQIIRTIGMTKLKTFGAHELIAIYRRGVLPPVEVTNKLLARIEKLIPAINAFCLVDAERSLDSARLSEQRWQAHRQSDAEVGGLVGVPVSNKAGKWTTSAGASSLLHHG